MAPLETEEVAKLAARDALREFSAERVARAPSQIRPCPTTLMSDRRPNRLQGSSARSALRSRRLRSALPDWVDCRFGWGMFGADGISWILHRLAVLSAVSAQQPASVQLGWFGLARAFLIEKSQCAVRIC